MGEELGEEGLVPTGAFELALHRALRELELDQIEGEPAEQRQVLGPVVLPDALAVLVKDHVEHPMQPVLNSPCSAVASAKRRMKAVNAVWN